MAGHRHEHVALFKGVEYCPEEETLIIDVSLARDAMGEAYQGEADDCLVFCVWRAFKKNMPHRPVRALTVRGVR